MKSREQPTEAQEKTYVKDKWNYASIVKEIGDVKGRRWKIRELELKCAFHAKDTNPLAEAFKEGIYAVGKAALAAIPAFFLYKLIGNTAGNEYMSMGQRASTTLLASPLTAGLIYLTKAGLFGSHPVSAYGNYYKTPYFGAADSARFCFNWLRIAHAQAKGKIRKGEGKLSEETSRILHHSHGGP